MSGPAYQQYVPRAGNLDTVGDGQPVPKARLGTGTASASTYLRGDGSWQSALPAATPARTWSVTWTQYSTIPSTTQDSDRVRAASSAIAGLSGGPSGYTLLYLTTDPASIQWTLSVAGLTSLPVSVTLNNSGDSVSRAYVLDYSLDDGATWTVFASGSWGVANTVASGTWTPGSPWTGRVRVRVSTTGSATGIGVGIASVTLSATASTVQFLTSNSSLPSSGGTVGGNLFLTSGAFLDIGGGQIRNGSLQLTAPSGAIHRLFNSSAGDNTLNVGNLEPSGLGFSAVTTVNYLGVEKQSWGHGNLGGVPQTVNCNFLESFCGAAGGTQPRFVWNLTGDYGDPGTWAAVVHTAMAWEQDGTFNLFAKGITHVATDADRVFTVNPATGALGIGLGATATGSGVLLHVGGNAQVDGSVTGTGGLVIGNPGGVGPFSFSAGSDDIFMMTVAGTSAQNWGTSGQVSMRLVSWNSGFSDANTWQLNRPGGSAIIFMNTSASAPYNFSVAGPVSATALTLTGLPTADPHVAGKVWSNGGVLTVSAG